MLSSSERALMIRYCHAHDVAFCQVCAQTYRIQRLAADRLQGKTELCPHCGADLSGSIRKHLQSCRLAATRRSGELLADAQALREASVIIRKEAQRIVDDAAFVLASFRSLRWLDLKGTGMTEKTVAELRRQLPDCQILY